MMRYRSALSPMTSRFRSTATCGDHLFSHDGLQKAVPFVFYKHI